jgi:hypothetical protein
MRSCLPSLVGCGRTRTATALGFMPASCQRPCWSFACGKRRNDIMEVKGRIGGSGIRIGLRIGVGDWDLGLDLQLFDVSKHPRHSQQAV